MNEVLLVLLFGVLALTVPDVAEAVSTRDGKAGPLVVEPDGKPGARCLFWLQSSLKRVYLRTEVEVSPFVVRPQAMIFWRGGLSPMGSLHHGGSVPALPRPLGWAAALNVSAGLPLCLRSPRGQSPVLGWSH